MQLLFCHYNTLLICNKNYYFSIELPLCSVHWTGSAQWDACSIFLFIVMWKPIIQYFIYSRLHRLCSGTEYHISSLLLLSQSSLYYAVLNLFLISIFYNSYYISLHFCTPNFYFFWIKKKDNQRLGQIPFWRDRKYTGAMISWEGERQAWVS